MILACLFFAKPYIKKSDKGDAGSDKGDAPFVRYNVVPVYPDYVSIHSANVTANQQYIIPESDEWYGLDSYEGVEEFYFIASLNQRPDLEEISKKFAKLARKPRASYKSVTQAAIVPATRGIVKIKAGKPAIVQNASGENHSFTPMSFLSTVQVDDLVITRWFNHKNL